MATGIGGSTADQELARLNPPGGFVRITKEEREGRLLKAQQLMVDQGIDALYLDASTSLFYFTGLKLWASERLHGAVLPARGELIYISPRFEEEKTRAMLLFGSDLRTWEEHEDPTQLVAACVRETARAQPVVAVDPATPFFVFDGLRQAMPQAEFRNGACVTAACRMHKSKNEIALMQYAMNLTLSIQESAARILESGISTRDVQDFLIKAHLKMGADMPPPFRIVLFGEPTAYPHGVPYPQELKEGDMVLIDVGARSMDTIRTLLAATCLVSPRSGSGTCGRLRRRRRRQRLRPPNWVDPLNRWMRLPEALSRRPALGQVIRFLVSRTERGMGSGWTFTRKHTSCPETKRLLLQGCVFPMSP